jgi:hypothetical protein
VKLLSASRQMLTAAAAATALTCLAGACSSSSAPSPTTGTTQPPPPTLTGISLNPTTVVGGNSVQGTVTMSGAPTSAANVTLTSNNAAATVPPTVTVNAGSTTATFTVTTAAVASATSVNIAASFSGSSQAVALSVTPVPAPALTANFTVRSLSPALRKLSTDPAPVTILPTGTEDACPLVGAVFDCVFDGSTSAPSASIRKYLWTYFVGPRTRDEESTTPVHKPTESSCGFFGGLQTSSAGGLQFISMRVDLRVVDASGNVSAVRSSQNVRVFPAGQCGYGF